MELEEHGLVSCKWSGCGEDRVPLKVIEYGVYGDLTIICPKSYSIYLRVTIGDQTASTGPALARLHCGSTAKAIAL